MQKRRAQGTLARTIGMTAAALLLISVFLPQLGLFGPVSASASSAQGIPLNQRFGIAATHLSFSDPATMDREFDLMAEAGVKWVRTEFAWADMEPAQGAWNFVAWDAIVNKAAAHGIQILGILMSSPAWANGGNWWNVPPTDLAAWSNYCSVVASRYEGKVAAWEIWNEPNIPQFWSPWPDPTNYTTLLKAASPAIRAADPHATVVMAGMAGFGADFMDACFQQGAIDYIDAIAYHPYPEVIDGNNINPQESTSRYLVALLQQGITKYTSRPIQIWITELGYTTCAKQPPGVDLQTQANYMLRSLQMYADTAVDKIFYFSLEDPANNPPDSTVNYGLVNSDLSAKPSYSYFRTFESLLGGAVSASSGAVEASCGDSSTLELHSFRLPDGGLVVAAWKANDAADTLNLTVKDPSLADPVTVDPATGQAAATPRVGHDASGNITVKNIAVGKNPVLLKMDLKPAGTLTSWYFAEGYTGAGFQEYLCLGNSAETASSAKIVYMFPDGGSQEQYVTVAPKSRSTVDVNLAVGAGREVSAQVLTDPGVVVERPMYFDYQGKWTGGHDVIGANAPATQWYFAEGYTGDGFDEWVCVLNPGNTRAKLTFHFQTQQGTERVIGGYAVPAHSRASFKVNDLLGAGVSNSLMLASDQPVVAERSMYFNYLGMAGNNWPGGNCVMGTSALSQQYLFAEGTTRDGFEEWLSIQNPNAGAIKVTANYQLGADQGAPVQKVYAVGPYTRITVFVPAETGYGKDVSVQLSSSSPFLAERPMYFRYTYAGADWTGGHCIAGSSTTANDWFFAEGYTGAGFHEWISLQNPTAKDSKIRITYYSTGGTNVVKNLVVKAQSRLTVLVNEQVGQDQQIATEVQVVSGSAIVAERPMYFSYAGWPGGHDVLGYTSK